MIGVTLLSPGSKERKPLDQLRKQIEDVNSQIDNLRSARLPVSESRKRLLIHLQPRMEELRGELGRITYPDREAFSEDPKRNSVITALAAVALLAPSEFDKSLTALLTAEGAEVGLPTAGRAKRVEELAAKLADLETAEEQEICRLESEGYCVERRQEVPIERLLAVWGHVST